MANHVKRGEPRNGSTVPSDVVEIRARAPIAVPPLPPHSWVPAANLASPFAGRECYFRSMEDKARRRRPTSPRQPFAVAEEAAGRAVVRQGGGPDYAGGPLRDGASAGAAHVGRDPTGTDRIDQHAGASEFRREDARQRVERRLAGRIGRRAGLFDQQGDAQRADAHPRGGTPKHRRAGQFDLSRLGRDRHGRPRRTPRRARGRRHSLGRHLAGRRPDRRLLPRRQTAAVVRWGGAGVPYPPCYENSILGPQKVMLGSPPAPRNAAEEEGQRSGREPEFPRHRTELLNHCEARRV